MSDILIGITLSFIVMYGFNNILCEGSKNNSIRERVVKLEVKVEKLEEKK